MEKTTITIVGLGHIGASIGLALQPHTATFNRVGITRDHSRGNEAKTKGALDKVAINLPFAVSDADVVILALPFDQIAETLGIIREDLKEGVLVLDASPVPGQSIRWAEELLPAGTNYIAFTPVLNPEVLLKHESGLESASAELFKRGFFAINATSGTSSEALNFAGDFATLLGATAMYSDPAEIDSYMAAIHLLPQLVAAGLAGSRIGAPGWDEVRKVAGRPFAQATNLLISTDRSAALASASVVNKEHVLRVLDDLIGELQDIRAEIDTEATETMAERLKAARKNRREWMEQRLRSDWLRPEEDMEGVRQASNVMGMMLGFGKPRPKREKKERDVD